MNSLNTQQGDPIDCEDRICTSLSHERLQMYQIKGKNHNMTEALKYGIQVILLI